MRDAQRTADHWYLAQIAMEVYLSRMGKKAKRKKLKNFMLSLSYDDQKPKPQYNMDTSKKAWLGAAGVVQ